MVGGIRALALDVILGSGILITCTVLGASSGPNRFCDLFSLFTGLRFAVLCDSVRTLPPPSVCGAQFVAGLPRANLGSGPRRATVL